MGFSLSFKRSEIFLIPMCIAWWRLVGGGAQRAKIVKKVHKPPLRVNVLKFELNGSIWVPWSPSNPKKLWCLDRSTQIHMRSENPYLSKSHQDWSLVLRGSFVTKSCQAPFICELLLFFIIAVAQLRFLNLYVKVSWVCGLAYCNAAKPHGPPAPRWSRATASNPHEE